MTSLNTRELERHGVDISLAPRRSDIRANQSIITVTPDGERLIAFDDVPHGTSEALSDETLSQAKVLLIDGYATQAASVLVRARDLGLAVVGDIEWCIGPKTERLLDHVDHLALPIGFVQSLAGASDAATILHKLWSDGCAAAVLTDGDKGANLRQKGDTGLWRIPAHKVTAVDTTGVGD
jgi:sugar/nucleoside kinase (ribokinase family)